MKLRLPKLLAAAVIALSLQASAVEITAPGEEFEDSSYYRDSTLTVNSHVVFEEDGYIMWCADGGGTLSGSGSLSCPDLSSYGPGFLPSWEFCASGLSDDVYTIEPGVLMRNVYLSAHGAKLVCKNRFYNAMFGGGRIDLTQATLEGYVQYEMASGTVITRPVTTFGSYGDINVWREPERYAGTYVIPVIEGNVVINNYHGLVVPPAGETVIDLKQLWNGGYANLASAACIYFSNEEKEDNYGTVKITGSLTINQLTPVYFTVEGTEGGDDSHTTWVSEYDIPADDECLIICSSVQNLQNLKPYVVRENTWEKYDEATDTDTEGGQFYYMYLNDYAFYAVPGGDGYVYIYLGRGGTGSGSPIPPDATVVNPGESLVLGKDESSTPASGKPIYLVGGTADASGLDASLLNNQMIQGTSGTLMTTSGQKMSLSGSGSVNYSIEGATAGAAGAKLDIAATGNLNLKGTRYQTSEASISAGSVTIASGSTLGMGTGQTKVNVGTGASLSNFGIVAGDVKLVDKSTMLNQGTIQGDIELESGSALVNNSTVTGGISVQSGALLSGSGSAESLLLASGASLNVGNSPGWQQYDSLTLERGSKLTFTVDGATPATATNNGAGTHSVLKAKTLTIGAGSGTVEVTVNVTLGITSVAPASLTLTLLQADTNVNAKEADFTLNINDANNLLEEGATLVFDEASGTLVLNGTVKKAAVAALMDSNAANIANTMWASANAVHEFARTAENQFLIGMPGQTTFWGAGLGSFMDISGDAGFTCNMGGYAVGMQHAFTESFRAGMAFGQSFGSFKADDEQMKADQMALMPALTAQYVTPLTEDTSLSISGHVAYGTVENEADIYQAGTAGKAEWDDKVLNIGVRAAWNCQLTEKTTVSFFTGLTYQSVDQDSFTEEFVGGGKRGYRSGSLNSLSLPVGITWRGVYQMVGTNIFVPEVTVAYIGDIARDNPKVTSTLMGMTREGRGTNIGRSAFMLNVGGNWMFDSTWSVGAFYTLETRSNQLNQSLNASLRCSF